jgi:hypothetical protein
MRLVAQRWPPRPAHVDPRRRYAGLLGRPLRRAPLQCSTLTAPSALPRGGPPTGVALAFLTRLSGSFNLVIVSNRGGAALEPLRVRRRARAAASTPPRSMPRRALGALPFTPARPRPLPQAPHGTRKHYVAGLCGAPERPLGGRLHVRPQRRNPIRYRRVALRGRRHKQAFAAALADRRSIIVDSTCPPAAVRVSPAKPPPAAGRARFARGYAVAICHVATPKPSAST